ncbi:MAG TPA: fasciclin domain-containing protein [Candidatus Eisenbacteria bacterium]|nr:fasciclin domain-containing protein [Candidatus Eisenbacteria bacterium]
MSKSRFIVAVMSVVALTVGLATQGAYAGEAKKTGPKQNIVQIARETGSFKTLVAALEATDLIGTLSGQGHGPFTVFAPTDEAFAKLPPGTVESLLKDPPALKKILLYHVVAGSNLAADVLGSSALPTLNGQSLAITNGSVPKVNDSAIIGTDILARNGVIHVIDTVLIPQN